VAAIEIAKVLGGASWQLSYGSLITRETLAVWWSAARRTIGRTFNRLVSPVRQAKETPDMLDPQLITAIATAICVAYDKDKRHQATRSIGLMASDTDTRGVQTAPPKPATVPVKDSETGQIYQLPADPNEPCPCDECQDAARTLVAVPSPVTMTAAEHREREADAAYALGLSPRGLPDKPATIDADSATQATPPPAPLATLETVPSTPNPLAASVEIGPAGNVLAVRLGNVECNVPPFRQGDVMPCDEIGTYGYWTSRTDRMVEALCVGKLANGKRVFRQIGKVNKKTGIARGKAILMSRTSDSVSWGEAPASQTPTPTPTRTETKAQQDKQARSHVQESNPTGNYSPVRVNGSLIVPAGKGDTQLYLFRDSSGALMVDQATGYYSWVSALSAKGKLAASNCHTFNERHGATSELYTVASLRTAYDLPL
jgi:hypothetical protein